MKDTSDAIVTSQAEQEGYMIVRAIAAKLVAVDRVHIRDSKSYCAILMDDNNRKPVCRLYFNSEKTMHLRLFGADKSETKVRITSPADIYQHCSQIEETISRYLT